MKKFALLAAVAATSLLAGCGVDPDNARRALEAQGITNVQIGGHAFFGCDKNDQFASNFTGVGVNGKPISGVLCGGIFKGITVRYD
jgi:opacity protein-like surface antigen